MAKADRGRIERALRKPPPDVRLFVLHGPDEAGSRALAGLLSDALGPDAERVDLAPATLKQDPALLADEAASRSLFGGARYLRIAGGGDDCLAAIAALLDAPVAGNVAVLIAGTLRRESKLLKLATASPTALVFASYPPEGAQAERSVAEMARAAGLLLAAADAQRLASACGGDRSVVAQEIEKLAIYADVAPDRPGPLPEDAMAALGAGLADADFGKLAEAVGSGAAERLALELRRFAEDGVEGIALLRPALRRLLAIAAARAGLDTPDARLPAIGFPSERERSERQASGWNAGEIAAALGRLAAAERLVKTPGGGNVAIAEETLLAVARRAARRR